MPLCLLFFPYIFCTDGMDNVGEKKWNAAKDKPQTVSLAADVTFGPSDSRRRHRCREFVDALHDSGDSSASIEYGKERSIRSEDWRREMKKQVERVSIADPNFVKWMRKCGISMTFEKIESRSFFFASMLLFTKHFVGNPRHERWCVERSWQCMAMHNT